MATRVIEEPSTTHVVHEHHESDESSNAGVIVAAIVILLFAILFIFYGLPLIRNAASPQVNVPGQVDVNLNSTTR